MEGHNKSTSIWGKWWEPIRKWFYTSWLAYEITARFYECSKNVKTFFANQEGFIADYFGKDGVKILADLSGALTFTICTAFLTIPACFALYQFFKKEDLTGSVFESKFKPWF